MHSSIYHHPLDLEIEILDLCTGSRVQDVYCNAAFFHTPGGPEAAPKAQVRRRTAFWAIVVGCCALQCCLLVPASETAF